MSVNIRLDNVRKVFPASARFIRQLFASGPQVVAANDKVAVDGVSLSIVQGECVGIIGSNGAGKSTLLHLIAGLSSKSSGKIDVQGKVTAVMTLGIGLREDMSGRENIYVDGEMQGKTRPEIDLYINDIVGFAELGEFIDQPVRTYSTGMKSRLGFSMISHLDPEILIIDEALSAGDASFARKAAVRIKEICARGQIVIIVSHSMQAIRDICNRCLWMDNGKIVDDGTPDEITRNYVDAVRESDEVGLRAKFQDLAGNQSNKSGWQVNDVTIQNGDQENHRSLIETGLPTRIKVFGGVPSDESGGEIRINISRLDDLLILDEKFDLNAYLQDDGTLGFEMQMDTLSLAAAVYKLSVSLTSQGAINAVDSSIFEVYSQTVTTGGRPILQYPVNVKVHPIDIQRSPD